MSKFQPRTLSEIMAMDTESLAWELAQYGRIEVLSDAPTDLSWRQSDGLPWTVVVWTYDSGENLSDEGALDESEWRRYGGATVFGALQFAVLDVHGLVDKHRLALTDQEEEEE